MCWHSFSRLLSDHFQRCFDHLLCGQPMMLVEIFGDVCRLTEFAANPKRAHFVSDPRQRKRMRNLRAHTVDDLMILDCNDAPGASLHRPANGFEIDAINEWIVDDRGGHALVVEL